MGEVRNFPKSKAENPDIASAFGIGAEAYHGAYFRAGMPIKTRLVTASDWSEFIAGWRAAQEIVDARHDKNLIVKNQEIRDLTRKLKGAQAEVDKLRKGDGQA